VICGNAFVGIISFAYGRNRFSETSLELDEFAPTNVGFASEAAASHAPNVVDYLNGANQNLFGITAAQSACAAKWPMVRDGHLPASGYHTMTGDACRCPASDDEQIICCSHMALHPFLARGSRFDSDVQSFHPEKND